MPNDSRTDESRPTTYNVLFVCTGNTCRSPMAEALARREIARRGWHHVEVGSAGVAAHPHLPATDAAIEAAASAGLDLSTHRSRILDSDLVDWADLILAMGPSHLAILEDLGAERKAALLGDFVAGADGAGTPVPDPFGGDVAVYRRTLDELDRLVARALDRLAPILQP